MKQFSLFTCLFFILLSFTSLKNSEEEKHTGKITTALGTYEGEFNIRLNEENKGMIKIKVADLKQQNNGKKQHYTQTLSINAMLVKSFETEGITYIIKNIAVDDKTTYSNCCLKVIDTCKVASLAFWGTSTQEDKCFVITNYNTAYQSLKSIGYITFFSLFNKCATIKEKIKQQPQDYKENYKKNSQQQLIEFWKTHILEYNNCFK